VSASDVIDETPVSVAADSSPDIVNPVDRQPTMSSKNWVVTFSTIAESVPPT
jgi:hypothetical protein